MNIKPFELVIVIACSDTFAFACLIKADRRVYQYILTPHGRNLFLQICSEQRRTIISTETYSLITGNLHSFLALVQ